MLKAVTELFDRLNRERIPYCHWKSNRSLDRALAGRTDLDLLVDRSQSVRFKQVLCELSIKPFVSERAKRYAGLEDYLGFDEESGRLFHLHVHYQLVLGERHVKNYRLPLEESFLTNPLVKAGVKIPRAELELILLCIRGLLKYRVRDFVKDGLGLGSPGLTRDLLEEIEHLRGKSSADGVKSALHHEFSLVSPRIVLSFLDLVTRKPRAAAAVWSLRFQLRRELKAYQRQGRLRANAEYLGILATRRLRRWLSFAPAKKVPVTGGAVIAIVGADGAGKSTMVEELQTWLSWKVDTHRCYMGTGTHLPLLSRQLRRVSRLTSRVHRIAVRLLGEGNAVAKALRSPHFLAESLFHISVAAMRARRHRVSRRMAAQGSLVLTDRYPLAGIWKHMTGPVAPMDGPRIAWLSRNGTPGRAEAYLARKEEAFYDTIGPPDCIVLLHVTAETALRRKPDHDPAVVKAKLLAVERLERSALHIIDVDSNRPFAETLMAAKRGIWARL
ncbi:MAG TPA: hypothetical protein VEK15_25430 [Vicinamibacteria bacterium]|nr:hypothetical protein [Vicinamibacteria bacterium]